MKIKNKHYFLIAGEASGDLHGAELMNELKKINDSIIFSGLGGIKMEQCGLSSLAPIQKLAVMGFWEVLKKYTFFLNLQKKVLNHIAQSKPDKIILIDYPGFNLRIAKKIKEKFNIPILYYISPQVWAWKEKRVNDLKKYVDSLIVIFPFEVDWFAKRNMKVQYFGHPLIDQWKKLKINTKTKNKFIIGLFPGSRKQEIERHLPLFENLIQKKKLINKNIDFVISRSEMISEKYFSIFKKYGVPILCKPSYQIYEKCSLAIVASGTATLECAISKTPFIVIYKMSSISWFITKQFVKIKFASIVNILNEDKIVSELIQEDCNIKNIIKEINYLLIDENYNRAYKKMEKVTDLLGNGTSYKQSAHLINDLSN